MELGSAIKGWTRGIHERLTTRIQVIDEINVEVKHLIGKVVLNGRRDRPKKKCKL